MTVSRAFAHHHTDAEAVARLAAGVAEIDRTQHEALKAAPVFADGGHSCHLVIGRSGATFDVTVTVDPRNVTIAGTENLIGHMAEGYLFGIVQDFFT